MFELGALDAEVGGLAASEFELGFSEFEVLAGGKSGVGLNPGELQGVLICQGGSIKQLPLNVQHAQFKIILRHLGLNGQPHIFEIGQRGLRFQRIGFHGVADAAP